MLPAKPPWKQSTNQDKWISVLGIAVGIFLLWLIPYLHIGVCAHYIWPAKPPVDAENCGCTCWDTVFKGPYQNYPSVKMKHWYFNATFNAYKIWCVVVLGLIIAYETFKYMISCVTAKDARFSMMMVILSTVYSHYYGWWMFLNYYNDQFYDQWYHQLYFTITELLSSGLVLYMVKRSHRIEPYHLLAIISINLAHIIIGGFDQFVQHILRNRGTTGQFFRDIGLVSPDILTLIVMMYEMVQISQMRRVTLCNLLNRTELGSFLIFTTAMVLIAKGL